MNQIVTLTGVEVKSKGSNKRGPWALRIFDSAGGTKFQTFDVELGQALSNKVGQAVEITYEVEENGDFQNNVIKSWKPAESGQSADDFQGNGSEVVASVQNGLNASADRELRIMRQSALDRAINTVGHGIVEIEGVKVTPDKINPYDLFRLADTYILYFEAGISAFTQPNEVQEEVVTY